MLKPAAAPSNMQAICFARPWRSSDVQANKPANYPNGVDAPEIVVISYLRNFGF